MDFHQKALLKWYKSHKRDLPWRATSNPYFIWLSEVIMQQTQVIQGLSYYLKFIEKYPKVELLAKAPADEVMKLWQGLGYYSRARNLHEAAKQIVKEHKGQFPTDFESILRLKGVGNYTAAAIASIAFNLPHAVVDGNVYRVLSRVFGIRTPIDSVKGKKEFQELANSLLHKKEAGIYNQAVMEFGALQCRPVNPDCSVCVLRENCFAFSKKMIDQLPVKEKKIRIKDRHLNYILYIYNKHTYIRKRGPKDIWQGLYEFYLVETSKKEKPENLLKRLKLKNAIVKKVSEEYKHVLSHQHLYARFVIVELKKEPGLEGFKKVKLSEIGKYAFPRLIEKHLKDSGLIP
jgi:A/G-specific adenine glycosylase